MRREAAGQPSVLGRIGWIFTGFGALFVLWGFVLRTQRSAGEGKMEEVAKTWIVIGFMVGGPFLMRAAMEGADSLYASSFGSPANLTSACVKAAFAMPELNRLFDVLGKNTPGQPEAPAGHGALIASSDDGSVLGYLEAYGVAVWDTASDYASDATRTWNGMVRLAAMATRFSSAMLKCLLIALTLAPLYLLLLAAAAVVWFMQQLRFFLALSGTMMLPLFTGMFSLPAGHFSQAGGPGLRNAHGVACAVAGRVGDRPLGNGGALRCPHFARRRNEPRSRSCRGPSVELDHHVGGHRGAGGG